MCQAFQSNGAKLGQHKLKMQLGPQASVSRPLAHATQVPATPPIVRPTRQSASIGHQAWSMWRAGNQRPKESRSESVNVRVWHSPSRNCSAAATHAASTGDHRDHAADA